MKTYPVILLELDQIQHDPRNVYQHDEDDMARLTTSILEYGFLEPLVVDAASLRLDEGRAIYQLVGGEARHIAAQRAQLSAVPVTVAEFESPEQRTAAAIALNGKFGRFDELALVGQLRGLADAEFDLSLTALSQVDLDSLLERYEGVPLDEHDDSRAVAEMDDGGPDLAADGGARSDGSLLALVDVTIGDPQHAVTRGQVWRLSERHTLVCSDVLTEHAHWVPYLTSDAIFCPFPGPLVPLGTKAEQFPLVLVQPDAYVAGHLLDRYCDIHGAQAVQQVWPDNDRLGRGPDANDRLGRGPDAGVAVTAITAGREPRGRGSV